MKLRSFQAPTMQEAMAQVRAAMGDDAIIIATHRSARGRGVQITAAIEDERLPDTAAPVTAALSRGELAERIARALSWHGVPAKLAERLTVSSLDVPTADAETALTVALGATLRFRTLTVAADTRVALIGAPGAGKTVTCAKLATQAALGNLSPTLVTTDTVRAGGVEQLQAFTMLLQRPLLTAEQPDDMAHAVRRQPERQPLLIDTAGTNPFAAAEMADLQGLLAAGGAEPILVLPVGGDAAESAEMAAAFALTGARRLIATRLDIGRRLGGLLAAAHGAGLAFAGGTSAAAVAHGYHPLSAAGLARLLLRDPERNQSPADLLERANAA